MAKSVKYGADPRSHDIFKKINLRSLLERCGARDNEKDLLWYGDTTGKYDMYIEGRVHITGPVSASNLAALALSEAQDFHVYKDLLVQHDATVKQDLIVEGHYDIQGSIDVDDIIARKDLLVYDDATVKGDIYVETPAGKSKVGVGQFDATVDNWVIKVVNGIIVDFRHKSA